MVSFPNIKINLGLHIIRKRDDGFHDLETCFYPLPWKEALEVLPLIDRPDLEGKDRLVISGNEVPGNLEDNILHKTMAFLREIREIPQADIWLHKILPTGAGLGGGSADAASLIKLADQVFDLKLSQEEMLSVATKAGSDCAFFILNTPCLATGRGEVLIPIELDLSAYKLCVIKPDISVSTAEAFSGIIPSIPSVSLKDVLQMPVSEWKNNLINDFQKPVSEKYPLISELISMLYDKGAVYAAMSGSGSAVFGMFDGEVSQLDLAEGCVLWNEKFQHKVKSKDSKKM